MGSLVDRTHRELTDEDLAKIAGIYHAWRGNFRHSRAGGNPVPYTNIPGFCKSASLDDIRKHGHVLTPGRYVGAEAIEDDGEPFAEKMKRLTTTLEGQFVESRRLEKEIRKNLKHLGFE